MKTTLKPISKSLDLNLSDGKLKLPQDIQKEIDNYWSKLLESGKSLTRGEVFSIKDIIDENDEIEINFIESDYAHYLYSRNIGLPAEFACINLHTSCLIETLDKMLIIGQMASHTAAEGNIQCVGGGLDKNDLKEGRIDYVNSIKRELFEEVNINADDKGIVFDFQPNFLFFYNEKIQFVAIIFIAKLKINAEEFEKRYADFENSLKQKNINPEFERLIYIPKDSKKVADFCEKNKTKLDYYIQPLLTAVSAD